MKYFLPIVLFICSSIKAQFFYVSGGYGQFVKHSENDNPITAYQNFEKNVQWSAGAEIPLKQSQFIQVNFGTMATSIPFKKDGGTVSEKTFPLDIRLFKSVSKMTGYGLGPTVTITNHSLQLFEDTDFGIEDIFNSVGIGINGLARVSFGPFYNTYILMDIGARYIKAIKFIGENRDFSNYSHEYGQVSISFGLGKKLKKGKS
ncbi:MAG: hypothetical protein ISR55_09270 [Bacteroidetes bacterium]|nr:hypothetical protein [Bacteroidota bacterium]